MINTRYFPAAPVQTSNVIGSSIPNGGAEAFVELQKALNIVGDYRLSTGLNTNRWAIPACTASITPIGGVATSQNDLDYGSSITNWGAFGNPVVAFNPSNLLVNGSPFHGNQGSNAFAMSASLETSNGLEISGLNAEEQSDIALIANWGASQQATNVIEVYSYYDAMIILRENNVVELIQ